MLPVMDRLNSVVRALSLIAALVGAASAAGAGEGFRLGVAEPLAGSGFLKYVLPRFSLKTGVRIELVGAGDEAEMVLAEGGEGTVVFTGQGRSWHMRIRSRDHAGAASFADWLTSEIGHRTIAAYRVDGEAPFAPAAVAEAEDAPIVFEGDDARGRTLSRAHCGRCHVVTRDAGEDSIGSTPSFFALKALGDWYTRFQRFYVLNPHPVFTQIRGVTEPFPIDRPSPIVPVAITPEEFDDILAYVATLAPVDLGGPLVHQ